MALQQQQQAPTLEWALNILGVKGVFSRSDVLNAYHSAVKAAADGKGGYQRDMDSLKQAKDFLMKPYPPEPGSSTNAKKAEPKPEEAERQLEIIRERARQEEAAEDEQRRRREREQAERAEEEERQQEQEKEEAKRSQEEAPDPIQTAAKLAQHLATQRAEAERQEQTRINAAYRIEEQLSAIARSVEEIRAALDSIMS